MKTLYTYPDCAIHYTIAYACDEDMQKRKYAAGLEKYSRIISLNPWKVTKSLRMLKVRYVN